MDDDRLFHIAPDALSVTARWEYPDGWTVVVASSAAGRDGRRTTRDRYDRLTPDELVAVVDSFLHSRLKGLSG